MGVSNNSRYGPEKSSAVINHYHSELVKRSCYKGHFIHTIFYNHLNWLLKLPYVYVWSIRFGQTLRRNIVIDSIVYSIIIHYWTKLNECLFVTKKCMFHSFHHRKMRDVEISGTEDWGNALCFKQWWVWPVKCLCTVIISLFLCMCFFADLSADSCVWRSRLLDQSPPSYHWHLSSKLPNLQPR